MDDWLLILQSIGLLYLTGVALMMIAIFLMIIALIVDYIRYGDRDVTIEEKKKREN
jgi:hypothetical protein